MHTPGKGDKKEIVWVWKLSSMSSGHGATWRRTTVNSTAVYDI